MRETEEEVSHGGSSVIDHDVYCCQGIVRANGNRPVADQNKINKQTNNNNKRTGMINSLKQNDARRT